MNKKIHGYVFFGLLLLILYSCRNIIEKFTQKLMMMESFGNQIIIQPDGSMDPNETTFSVLTYDSSLDSGYTQVSTCNDDNSWKNGEKKCRDYSIVGSNCDDIGDDGRSALEACKVGCDNCLKYTEIKRRIPSPMEDTEEPPYSQFDSDGSGSGSGFSDGGNSREIMNRLTEMDEKMKIIGLGDGTGMTLEQCSADLKLVSADTLFPMGGREGRDVRFRPGAIDAKWAPSSWAAIDGRQQPTHGGFYRGDDGEYDGQEGLVSNEANDAIAADRQINRWMINCLGEQTEPVSGRCTENATEADHVCDVATGLRPLPGSNYILKGEDPDINCCMKVDYRCTNNGAYTADFGTVGEPALVDVTAARCIAAGAGALVANSDDVSYNGSGDPPGFLVRGGAVGSAEYDFVDKCCV